MLQAHSTLRAFLKKYVLTSVLAVAPVLLTGSAGADDSKRVKTEPAVRLLDAVPVPVSAANTTSGAMYSFDISWVDQTRQVYYLADRSNKSVDSLDAKTPTVVTQFAPNNGHGPFAGFTPCVPPAGANDCAGPNGVATAPSPQPWLFVTDAPSRVLCFDTTFTPPKTVSEIRVNPTDPTRTDELAYDPADGLILATNNAASPPYSTLISVNKATCALSIVKTISLPFATNGAEQAVWDPGTGKFYLSIPQISGVTTLGAVLRISTAGTIEAMYAVALCSPAGLTLGPNEELLVGCNVAFDTAGGVWTGNADSDTNVATPYQVILDATTGFILRYVPGVGPGDEVWFNSGDGHYYTASSGSPYAPNAITPARPPLGTATKAPTLTAQGAAVLGVIDAFSRSLDQLVPTFQVPAVVAPDVDPHPAGTAHSVAANSRNNLVFVPIAANNAFGFPYASCLKGCIAVYGRSDNDKD
jgi:hypothetical protein